MRLENNDSKKVKTNEGLSIAAGFRKRLTPNSEIYATMGWKTGGVFASNGNISWSSLPVEGTYLAKIDKLLIGVGVSYFFNPKLDAEDVGTHG